jgi:hypothetical protein
MSKRFVVSAGVFIVAALILLVATRPARLHQSPATVSPIYASIPPSAPASSISLQGSRANPLPSSTVETSDWLTYRNHKYGYSFRYPSGYSFRINVPDLQILANPANASTGALAGDDWVSLTVRGGPKQKPFLSEGDFIIRARHDLQNYCSYSGSDELTLTDVESESTSTNQNGILYYQAYFKYVRSGNPEAGGLPGTRVLGIVGPFYDFDIEQQTQGLSDTLELAPAQCSIASLPPTESPTLHAFVQSLSF